MGRWDAIKDDIGAGLTGAVAGAPQAMGFALIAGVSPIYGLYTAFVSTIIGALVGSSTFMTVGPTNALSLVVASTLIGFEGQAEIERLFVLTLLVGIFTLIFAVLRLGTLIRFVSNAVMTGFITGAGLLIILQQFSNLNGYDAQGSTTLLRLVDWLGHLGESNPYTVVIGIVAFALIVIVRRTPLSNYAILVAIAVTSLLVVLLGWESQVTLVRDLTAVPHGIPLPVLPDISLIPELTTAALAMTVLGIVQSAAITNGIPEPDGSRADVTRDMAGIGVANIVGSVFQGMPACGSLSRTAVNMAAGARTRWANIFAGGFVALFLILLGWAIELVTLAALAAQLVVAAISLIRVHELQLVWQVNWPARIAMVATLVSTLVLPLEYSIYIGVGLSLLMYIYTSAANVSVEYLIREEDGLYRAEKPPSKLPTHEVAVFSIHGHLYFAAIRELERMLPDPKKSQESIVVLRLRENRYLGSTGIHFLQEYDSALRAHGGKLVLAGLSPAVRQQLERTGVSAELGEENLFDADAIVLRATNRAHEHARRLLDRVGDV